MTPGARRVALLVGDTGVVANQAVGRSGHGWLLGPASQLL